MRLSYQFLIAGEKRIQDRKIEKYSISVNKYSSSSSLLNMCY